MRQYEAVITTLERLGGEDQIRLYPNGRELLRRAEEWDHRREAADHN